MPRSAGGDGWKKNVLLEDEDAADEVRERLDTEAERLEEEDRFAAADADNDGELEGEQEIAAGFRQAGEAQELTEDEDGDGVVDALDFDGVHNLIRDKDAVKLSADGVKRFSRKGTRECTRKGGSRPPLHTPPPLCLPARAQASRLATSAHASPAAV